MGSGLKIFRIIFVIVSYALICATPNDSSTFYNALAIFTAGMCYDYMSMRYAVKCKNCTNERKCNYQYRVAKWGGRISILFFLIAVLGLANVMQVETIENIVYLHGNNNYHLFRNIWIPFDGFLILLLAFPILAGFEAFNKHERMQAITNSI